MSKTILQDKGINLKDIGQMQTTKYGVIVLFDLNGDILTKLMPDKDMTLNKLHLLLYSEVLNSECDPRKFINTSTDDLIRSSIIGKVDGIEDRGVAIYDSRGLLIHWFDEPNNFAIDCIVSQIEEFPTLPKEQWNPFPMADDPDDFIEQINWDIRIF